MIKFIQCNLNHCRVAQDLLDQYMVEQKVDVALVSDPHLPTSTWYADNGLRRAAIHITGDVTIGNVVRDTEFVTVRINGVQVYSCYASPNRPLDQSRDFLQRLENSIRMIAPSTPVLITGDFNARSALWGDWVNNQRGEELSTLLHALDLVIANTGSTPTFTRGAGSIVDITAMSQSLTSRIHEWRVMSGVFNNSDHHYIQFGMGRTDIRNLPNEVVGWNTSSGIDEDSFHCGLLAAEWLEERGEAYDAEMEAKRIEARITWACDYAIPKRHGPRSGKPPVHWWNTEISTLRTDCVRAKRSRTRMRERIARLRRNATVGFDNERAEAELTRTDDAFREAKKRLKIAILRSKKSCWTELIESVDRDPFGKPYKMVMRKLQGPPATATMEVSTLKTVVHTLFPVHQRRADDRIEQADDCIPFTMDEVNEAVARFKARKKAPGPDGISAKIVGAVHKCDPNVLLNLYNTCLRCGSFPERWKRARVVLLRKGSKPEGVPSSYRPLCLLNDTGKIMEFLLARRLEAHLKTRDDLASNQYGFRSERSTDDAVSKLDETIVSEKNRGKYVLAVSIDIKNAFNSVRWSDIMKALQSWEVPPYLRKMFGSYFSQRSGSVASHAAPGGKVEISITGGVPQGSVVGPLLWNMTYNEVLKEDFPEGCSMLGFADDTLLVVAAKKIPDLEHLANRALERISRRIADLGLQIAAEKTEAVLFTDRYKYAIPNIAVAGTPIKLAEEMTYLGIVIDRRCLFQRHMEKASQKAEQIGAGLARPMPNIGGPRESRRWLLASVVHSVLLYGAPSWAHTLDLVPGNVKILNKTQRKVLLRKVCAYRTVSEAATCVIAGIAPADLIARSRKEEHSRRRDNAGDTPRYPMIEEWQRRWDGATTGLWTKTLIPSLRKWTERRFGEVNFHLSQFLSGHGCFGKYLFKIKKAENTSCVDCGAMMDDAAHAFFICGRWERQRRELEVYIGKEFSPQTAVESMLETASNWAMISSFVDHVLSARENEERERQQLNNYIS